MPTRSFRMMLLIASVQFAAASAFAQERTITIAAVGDIMMGTNYPNPALPANSGRDLFRNVGRELQSSDIRVGNLEGPLYDGELPPDGKRGGANRYLFRTPTSYGRLLSQAGFNVLSLANNHARDFGRGGLESTRRTLRALGIQYSGKDASVAVFRFGQTSVALISADYYPGPRSMTSPQPTYLEIRSLKNRFDIVIVSIHAGGEGEGADHVRRGPEYYMGENRGDSVTFARKAIDYGADLIMMHGPHVPRGMEIYRDRLVLYSLGNFLTEKGISVAGKAGLAPLAKVQLAPDGRFLSGKIVSFQQTRSQGVVNDPSSAAARLMQNLSETDFPDSSPSFTREGDFFSRSRQQ